MKTAIITGTSTGLGFEIAKYLLDSQYRVLGLGRQAPEALSSHPHYEHLVLDLETVEDSLPAVKEWISKLDAATTKMVHFVHNAAQFTPVGMMGQVSSQQIIQGLDINLVGPVVLTNAVVSAFQSREIPLHLIFISSRSASHPMAGSNFYGVAKAGIEMLVKGIDSEIAQFKTPLKCCSFNPGRMNTQMQEQLRAIPVEQLPNVGAYQEMAEKGLLQNPAIVAKKMCEHLIELDFQSGQHFSMSEFW